MPDKGRVEGPWLSPEDERLLKLLAEDRSTREIADELGVSPSTVDAELSPASTRWARQSGWASPARCLARSSPSPLTPC
jgi:FixJ family two-component response regulator